MPKILEFYQAEVPDKQICLKMELSHHESDFLNIYKVVPNVQITTISEQFSLNRTFYQRECLNSENI